jgi:hypothetical protein
MNAIIRTRLANLRMAAKLRPLPTRMAEKCRYLAAVWGGSARYRGYRTDQVY